MTESFIALPPLFILANLMFPGTNILLLLPYPLPVSMPEPPLP